MSGNTDDPESTIPWPGFVDILSTVIIVFVFFMMMTSVIIFILSEEAKNKAVEEAKKQSAAAQQEASVDANMSPEISEILKENNHLRQELEKILQAKSVLAESTQQFTALDGKTATIRFGDLGVTLLPETIQFIQEQLPFDGRITLIAVVPSGTDFGATREIALNRALNIRNVLIQSGVRQDRITLKITNPQHQNQQTDDVYGSVNIAFGSQ